MVNLKGTRYWISKDGLILRDGIKPLKPEYNEKGYQRVTLSVNGKIKKYFVHRLIAETYIPNPNNLPFVNHLNHQRNDNRVDNLEWITTQDNNRFRKNHTKLDLVKVEEIRKDLISTGKELSKKYNVSEALISRVKTNKNWI
jgi:hypothetical protein